MVEIDGVVVDTTNPEKPLDPDTFLTEFIRWIESKGYFFAGSIGPFKDEDDNN